MIDINIHNISHATFADRGDFSVAQIFMRRDDLLPHVTLFLKPGQAQIVSDAINKAVRGE
jgi:hypothetical protein